jgi:hypothetical protein
MPLNDEHRDRHPGVRVIFVGRISGRRTGSRNLKRAQQDCADESKRGAQRQHIQPQGYVHARPPSLLNIPALYQSLMPDRNE